MPDAAALEIRRAARDDVEALASLRPFVHDRHVQAHPDYFKPLSRDVAARLAESWFSRADIHVLLASLAGEPIGYLVATIAERPEVEALHARRVVVIDQIAVETGAQGQGCGKALLAAGVALARELGVSAVDLEVYHFNAGPRAFFLSQGSQPLRERLTRAVE